MKTYYSVMTKNKNLIMHDGKQDLLTMGTFQDAIKDCVEDKCQEKVLARHERSQDEKTYACNAIRTQVEEVIKENENVVFYGCLNFLTEKETELFI